MVRWRLFSDKKYLNFRAKNQQFWTFLANWKFEWNIFGDFRNQLNCACSRPTGGTCGLSLPVGLALLHLVRVRRRSRSHFYSLQTARQGERKIFESLSESERKRAALLFCFYTQFDNEKKWSWFEGQIVLSKAVCEGCLRWPWHSLMRPWGQSLVFYAF